MNGCEPIESVTGQPSRRSSWFAGYTFVDYATQGYLLLTALLMLVFHNERTPNWVLILTLHSLALPLVHLLIHQYRRRGGAVLGFLRHFYPVLLYTGFYRETGELNRMFFSGYLDGFFIGVEQKLFGTQPCLAWMEQMPQLVISEIFYIAYFSYYIMIVGVGITLFLRDREQFFHYVSVVSFVFYCCYLTYIVVPVIGPRVFYMDPVQLGLSTEAWPVFIPPFPDSVQAGLFYRLLQIIYHNFETIGAAFPSSHVAVALCTAYFSWRYLPKIRYLHLVMAILLCLSTVYCRYHYVVDVVAGVVTAAILVPVGNYLYGRFIARDREGSDQEPEPKTASL